MLKTKNFIISSGLVLAAVFSPVAVFADHNDLHTINQLQAQLASIQQAIVALLAAAATPADPHQGTGTAATPAVPAKKATPTQSVTPAEPAKPATPAKPVPAAEFCYTCPQPIVVPQIAPALPAKEPMSPEVKAKRQEMLKQMQSTTQSLQTKVDDLRTNVQATTPSVPVAKSELNLTERLGRGSSGEEVRELQGFLKRFPDIYPEGLVTGYYGPLTETAVKRFQEKHEVDAIGVVGPKTIAKFKEFASGSCVSSTVRPCYDRQAGNNTFVMNENSGKNAFTACINNTSESQRGESVQKTSVCGEEKIQFCFEGRSQNFVRKFEGICKATPPISVVYPNGGEEISQGYNRYTNQFVVDPIAHPYAKARYYDIKFSGGKGQYRIMLVKENVTNNTDPRNLIVGTFGYGTLYPGLFTESGLTVNTWEPTFAICAGIGEPWLSGSSCNAMYITPGRYKILVLSENENGELLLWDDSSNKPGNWDVSDEAFTIVPHSKIKVISPNGGEVYSTGSNAIISWEAMGIDSKKVSLYLLKRDKSMVYSLALNVPLSFESGSFNYIWKVPDADGLNQQYNDNQYYIAIQEVFDGESGGFANLNDYVTTKATDLSDSSFTLSGSASVSPLPSSPPPPSPSPTPTTTTVTVPAVTIRSPNGGQTWIQSFKGSVFWVADTANSVNVNLLKGGVLDRVLATNVPAKKFSGYNFQNMYPDAYHAWVSIPADVAEGSSYSLEVVDAINSAVRDVSDSSFRVIPLYSPVTVGGKFIDRFTQLPLANVFLGGYDSLGNYTSAYTNANGEFSLTSTIAGIAENASKSLFGTWPACYKSQGAGWFNYYEAIYASFNEFDLSRIGTNIPVWNPAVNLGDIKFWPAVTISVFSDVTGKFIIEYPEEATTVGTSLTYNAGNTLSNVIPLDYNVRVKIVDNNGNVYYSPYLKLGLDHGCGKVTLRFIGGQFTWETQ